MLKYPPGKSPNMWFCSISLLDSIDKIYITYHPHAQVGSARGALGSAKATYADAWHMGVGFCGKGS